MKITKEIPSDWRNLQNLVCKYLNQAGYCAEVAKTIDTVRGKLEVDVFATAENELLKRFICECKFWKTAVPKEKIHAFRTQVQDSGSMVGIFISSAGYQSGAVEAAKCSNVLLKDWDGFVELIANQWLRRRLIHLKKVVGPLSIYTDPMDVPKEIFSFPKDAEKYREMANKYMRIYMVSASLGMGVFDKESIELDGIMFDDLNSLFDYVENTAVKAIREFDELFEKYPIEQWKFDCLDYMGVGMLKGLLNEEWM